MNRFFVKKDDIYEDFIEIKGEDVKHIRNVLRLKEEDKLELVEEEMVYIGEIIEIAHDFVRLKKLDSYPGKNESNVDIYLYQGIAKGSKMDFILQKCTELGVKKFIPLETERTVVMLKGDKKIKSRLERWNQITQEASKQSKRDIVPRVEEIMTIDELCVHLKGAKFSLVPYELEGTRSFKEGLDKFDYSEPIHIIIGPEGGFELEEIKKLEAVGVKAVSLGPRILRTETAGIVSSTMALYEFGDLGVR